MTGANVAGSMVKSIWRSGLDSLGLSASEYIIGLWLGGVKNEKLLCI